MPLPAGCVNHSDSTLAILEKAKAVCQNIEF